MPSAGRKHEHGMPCRHRAVCQLPGHVQTCRCPLGAHVRRHAPCSVPQHHASRALSLGQTSWYTVWNLAASSLEPLHAMNAWRFSRASEGPVTVESPRRACQARPTAQLVQPVEPYRRNLEPLHTINAWRLSRAPAGPCHGRISTWRLLGSAAEGPVENDETFWSLTQNIGKHLASCGDCTDPGPRARALGF